MKILSYDEKRGIIKLVPRFKEDLWTLYQVIEKEVRKIISDVVRNEYADTFKQIIKEQLTEDVMAKIAHKALSYLYDS